MQGVQGWVACAAGCHLYTARLQNFFGCSVEISVQATCNVVCCLSPAFLSSVPPALLGLIVICNPDTYCSV
jgi:hypothetical protein